jgi:hypothetical protein
MARVMVLYPTGLVSAGVVAEVGDVVEVDEIYVAGLVAQGWAKLVEPKVKKIETTKKTETATVKLRDKDR